MKVCRPNGERLGFWALRENRDEQIIAPGDDKGEEKPATTIPGMAIG